jgi:two-component system phosphate regulon response regulator PhoB
MAQQILIVEDEPSIAELIAINLSHAGYQIDRAFQADEALQILRTKKIDLIILDWMLPGKSGVQFAKELRAKESTQFIPILMLTAKSAEADKIMGLDAGADDYVTKPFSPNELIARVRALLRRQSTVSGTSAIALSIGPISLDTETHRVFCTWPNKDPISINLGPTEFRLLQFFMMHPERVHTRAQLLDKVWGDHIFIEERTVDVHIKRLREALGDAGNMIETVRGVGYRFTQHPPH